MPTPKNIGTRPDDFWKTNEFRERIQRIKARNLDTPAVPEPEQPKLELPIPRARREHSPRPVSIDTIRANIEKQVRDSIVTVQPSTFMSRGRGPGPGQAGKIYRLPEMSDEDVNRLVNDEVKKRLEAY